VPIRSVHPVGRRPLFVARHRTQHLVDDDAVPLDSRLVQVWLRRFTAPKPLPPVHPLPTGHAPDARPLWAEERSPIRQRSVR